MLAGSSCCINHIRCCEKESGADPPDDLGAIAHPDDNAFLFKRNWSSARLDSDKRSTAPSWIAEEVFTACSAGRDYR
jgi:hypothetical protein